MRSPNQQSQLDPSLKQPPFFLNDPIWRFTFGTPSIGPQDLLTFSEKVL